MKKFPYKPSLFPHLFRFILTTIAILFYFASANAQPGQGNYQERVTPQTNVSDKDFLDKLQGPQFKARGFTPKNNDSSAEQSPSLYYFINKKFEIKAEANLKSKAYIATVQPGDKVELLYIIEDHGASQITWTKIRTEKGEEGFIPEDYIQKDKPDVRYYKRDLILKQPKTQYVITSFLKMRDKPSIEGMHITSLARDTELIVTRYSDHKDYIDGHFSPWAYVKTNEQSGAYQGWVFSAYISNQKIVAGEVGPQEDPNHIFSGSSKFVKSKILHLRDEPSKYGMIIAAVPHGNQVSIIERKQKMITIAGLTSVWVLIQTGNHRGWVFGAFLSNHQNAYLPHDHIDKPFQNPLGSNNGRLTSPYGRRIHPISNKPHMHTGLDLAIYSGHPIYAAGDGVIYLLRDQGKSGYGKYVVVKHDNELFTLYAHQSKFKAREGDRVRAGDIIGYIGSTGASTGPHIHFEVRTSMSWADTLNPADFFLLPE